MKHLDASAQWTRSPNFEGTDLTLPAAVPGNVALDLIHAGIVPDPYRTDHIHLLTRWELADWTYSTTLTVPSVEADELITLHFGGIDTLATVFIGGAPVATSESMFVPVDIDVTRYSGEPINVEVRIDSVVAREWHRERQVRAGALPYNYESLYVRKARHSFGWDIAPRLVTAGIWREVRFEVRGPYEIDDLYAYTMRADEHSAELGIDWNTTIPIDRPGLILELTLTSSDGTVAAHSAQPLRFPTGRTFLTVERPSLWWPSGYGSASLYTIAAEIREEGRLHATRRETIGIRTVALQRSDAISGRSKEFVFIVNGERIFVRGSNWVPSDAIHSRCAAKCRTNLEPYIESHCNMLRVWGGGIYEDRSLFDGCDENGIMVWQDFMFGCETPPRDGHYHDLVRTEVAFVARRYRNHASLVLWCGDNENDMAMRAWNGGRTGTNELTRTVIPETLADHDPYRPYLASSPYISEEVWSEHLRTGRPIDSMVPEQHLWGPRDAFKGDFYRLNTAVFASEIGYHGSPSVTAMRKFLDPDALDRTTEAGRSQWVTHATQPYGDRDGRYAYRVSLMEKQVGMLFGEIPDDLERFAAASQISQAEAKKFFIEQFRMRKWEKSGIIWWNMQDMWPQFSDAVIDYYGEKKLAWYYIARSQSPVCFAIDEPGSWKRAVVALNDTRSPVRATWRVREIGGSYDSGTTECIIPANTSKRVGEVPYEDSRHRLFIIEWESDLGAGKNHHTAAAPPWSLDVYLTVLPEIIDGALPPGVEPALRRIGASHSD